MFPAVGRVDYAERESKAVCGIDSTLDRITQSTDALPALNYWHVEVSPLHTLRLQNTFVVFVLFLDGRRPLSQAGENRNEVLT